MPRTIRIFGLIFGAGIVFFIGVIADLVMANILGVSDRDLDDVLTAALASVAPNSELLWVVAGMVTVGAIILAARSLRPVSRRSQTVGVVLGTALILGVSTELYDHTSLMHIVAWGILLTTVVSGIICVSIWAWLIWRDYWYGY